MSQNEGGGAMAAMPRYRCHKEVYALKIESIVPVAAGYQIAFSEPGWSKITVPDEFCARGKPASGDYYVVYDDGYKSWSPAKAFEDGYTLI